MDASLLEILVCPLCKSSLYYNKENEELICKPDRLAYPIVDGIPIMWVDKARQMTDDEF